MAESGFEGEPGGQGGELFFRAPRALVGLAQGGGDALYVGRPSAQRGGGSGIGDFFEENLARDAAGAEGVFEDGAEELPFQAVSADVFVVERRRIDEAAYHESRTADVKAFGRRLLEELGDGFFCRAAHHFAQLAHDGGSFFGGKLQSGVIGLLRLGNLRIGEERGLTFHEPGSRGGGREEYRLRPT